jgi:hypothetical protein
MPASLKHRQRMLRNRLTGRPSKAPRHVLPTTRWKVGRRRLARGRAAGALHGCCGKRQLIDLIPRVSDQVLNASLLLHHLSARGQSGRTRQILRVSSSHLSRGQCPLTGNRPVPTDLSEGRMTKTKQGFPDPLRGESWRRLHWARITNSRGPRRSRCSSCHSKRSQASCGACT